MASEEDRIQDIDSLAKDVAWIKEKLSSLVGGQPPVSHAQAQQDTEQHLNRPTSVEEQVRSELARAKAEQDAAAAADAKAAEQETLGQRVAKLEEKTPEPPQPRRQRVMWGNR